MSGLVPFFARVSLAGAISCSATHSLVVPLDVMKTRMQTDANVKGLSEAAGAVLASAKGRGPIRLLAFFNGLSATATGYFLQGAAKFGGYEALKHATFTRMRALPDGERLCAKLRLPVMCVSAAAAEFIATGLLCPLEVIKLRVQTDSVAAARGMGATLAHILRHEGAGALYKGLSPIAMRQVPYTVVKLVSYEVFSALLLSSVARAMATARARRHAVGDDAALVRSPPAAAIALGAGLMAGAAAAISSQPADVLLTRMCGSASVSTLSQCVIAKGWRAQLQYLYSIGLKECYSGLGPRLAMISSMTSVQFLLYDSARRRLQCFGPPPAVEVSARLT